MYSDEKNVQILIDILKQNKIQEIILSPGGSVAPIVQSFQHDSYFNCHSVVDERNSVYFAIGISQVKNCPVACVCTSGTAVSNFMPGMTEAFYQGLPIIAITADISDYMLGHLKLQKISQSNIFNGVTKWEGTLPVVKDNLDEWACNSMVNTALIEMSRHGKGPVHINIPITTTLACNTRQLPKQRIVKHSFVSDVDYEILAQRLIGKKIMVVVGQGLRIDEETKALFEEFFDKFNCFFSVESVSNVNCKGSITTYPMTETGLLSDDVVPDIVLSLGNHIASYNLEGFLRKNRKQIQTLRICEDGKLRDPYQSLTEIIEGSVKNFFTALLAKTSSEANSHNFYEAWHSLQAETDVEEFSSMKIARKLMNIIPNDSIIHTAVLNSTRIVQFTDYLKKTNTKFFCNLGTLGIDGCVATFIGESVATKDLAFLFIGDLSFFYGMNAISIKGVSNNVRIILFNNAGGEEFKIKMDYPQIEDFVCASKKRHAEGWAKDCGYQYFAVDNEEEFDAVADKLVSASSKPILCEINLNMNKDAGIIRNLYSQNKQSVTGNPIKELVKQALPTKYANKASEIYRIIRS